MADAKAVLKAAEGYGDDIARFLIELISIKSLSGKENEVARRIAQEMREAGFDEVRTDGLGSVVGQIGKGKRVIAFDAHIDTVDAGDRDQWSRDPFVGHIEGGKIFGRGAADQKSGMASMVYAGKIIKELGLESDFTLLFTGTVMEEDCDGLCWDYLIKEEGVKPELCVITEPTGLSVCRGQRGRMEIEASVAGVSAHGSAPERGENAIYKMAPIVLEIEKLNDGLKSDEFLGKGTVVMSRIRSSAPSLCAVPDVCSVYLDRRLTAGEDRETALSQIEDLVGGAGGKVRVPVYESPAYTGMKYPMEKYYPSWTVEESHPGVVAVMDACRELFGSAPDVGKWTFSTNGVAICGLHKIPCVGFGPGFEEQAHAPNEWVPVEHLWKAAAFYAWYPVVVTRNS
jgi:putative selenium metabolism hydrolase